MEPAMSRVADDHAADLPVVSHRPTRRGLNQSSWTGRGAKAAGDVARYATKAAIRARRHSKYWFMSSLATPGSMRCPAPASIPATWPSPSTVTFVSSPSAISEILAVPLTNPGPPLPSTSKLVAVGLLLIDDGHFTLVGALDRRDAHAHDRVKMVGAGFVQRLRAGDARPQRVRIQQQGPDLLRLTWESKFALDSHVAPAWRAGRGRRMKNRSWRLTGN